MNEFNLTSNQFYGGINRRFDARAKQLRKLGFVYQSDDILGIAFFARLNHGGAVIKGSVLPACFVSAASKRLFVEAMQSAYRQSRYR